MGSQMAMKAASHAECCMWVQIVHDAGHGAVCHKSSVQASIYIYVQHCGSTHVVKWSRATTTISGIVQLLHADIAMHVRKFQEWPAHVRCSCSIISSHAASSIRLSLLHI